MSFLLSEGSGRRRVAHVSNDAWRAALQQQIDEKKAREEQLKRERSLDDARDERSSLRKHESSCRRSPTPEHTSNNSDNNNNNNNNNRDDGTQEQSIVNEPLVRPGRRTVQHMSNDAWREALEQQIREKKAREQEVRGAGARARQSQSAPSQDQDCKVSDLQHHERAMTTPAIASNNAVAPAHGRRRTSALTHEEHLQALQEQLAVQKRFEEEALAFKRAQRQMRRKLLDDSDDSSSSAAAASAGRDGLSSNAPSGICDAAQETAGASSSRHGEHEAGEQSSGTSTSADASDRQPLSPPSKAEAKLSDTTHDAQTPGAAPAPAPASDPVALAKIVDFCHELKRQNEDVKQQLMAQHSVLASLHSSLADPTATAATAAASGTKKSSSASARSVHTRPQATANAKPPTAVAAPACERAPVVRPRPSRGESKIPYPPHATAPATVLARAVAEPKHARYAVDCKAPEKDEKVAARCRESRAALESTACGDATEQDDAAIANADAKASAARAEAATKDCDLKDKNDDDDDAGAAPEQLTERTARSVDRERKAEDAAWDAQHKTRDDDDDDETEIVCTDAYVVIETKEDDELPLGGESHLLLQSDARASARQHDDDDDVEIESCSSFQLVASASALVALDRPLTELFE